MVPAAPAVPGALRSQLERSDPALAVKLTRRAAEWCAANDLPGRPSSTRWRPATPTGRPAWSWTPPFPSTPTAAWPSWSAGSAGSRPAARSSGTPAWPCSGPGSAPSPGIRPRPSAGPTWPGGRRPAPGPRRRRPRAAGAAPGRPLPRTGWSRWAPTPSSPWSWRRRAAPGRPRPSCSSMSHLLAGRQDQAERHLADAAEVGEDAGVDAGMLALAERSVLAMARGVAPGRGPGRAGLRRRPRRLAGAVRERCCTRCRPGSPSTAATSPGPGTTWPRPSGYARC